jgi:hypothetical protein
MPASVSPLALFSDRSLFFVGATHCKLLQKAANTLLGKIYFKNFAKTSARLPLDREGCAFEDFNPLPARSSSIGNSFSQLLFEPTCPTSKQRGQLR